MLAGMWDLICRGAFGGGVSGASGNPQLKWIRWHSRLVAHDYLFVACAMQLFKLEGMLKKVCINDQVILLHTRLHADTCQPRK
jgi:hypothetical protein